MRKLLFIIGIIAFADFSSAQRLRERVGKLKDIDSQDDNILYIKKREISVKQEFTEPNEEDDAGNRRKRSLESDPMLRELQGDLKGIRGFAQEVRPMAKNMRRAMGTRRGLRQEMSVIAEFFKKMMMSIVNATDKYLPVLKPVTKYIRKFIVRAFDKNHFATN